MKGGTRKRGKTWSYYFDAAQIGGSRKKIEKGGFRTKKDAETALAKALVEYENSGQIFVPSEISVSDHLDQWMDQYCKPNLSNRTVQTYEYLLRKHIKPRFGQYRIRDIQASAVQNFINDLKKGGYSKSTITSILVVFSSSMKYAIEPMRYIKENPCQYVRIGKVEKPARKREIISDEDFDRIIEMFPFGHRYHLLLQLGWHCGLRINEASGLTWEDIDLDKKVLTINKQIYRYVDKEKGLSCQMFANPKHDSFRTIPFGETLCQILKAEKKRQKEEELRYGEYYLIYKESSFTDQKGILRQRIDPIFKGEFTNGTRRHFVCIDENGALAIKETFGNYAPAIRKKLGINFDYHSLRHTHATKLVEAGANIKAIQKRLGHKNVSVTMNTYAHSTEMMDQDAAMLFERSLPPAK